MNMFMLCAEPARAEPMAKNTMHDSKTGLRPKIDTNPPHSGIRAVAARGYAPPAQIKFVPCRSCTMVGSVVETEVW